MFHFFTLHENVRKPGGIEMEHELKWVNFSRILISFPKNILPENLLLDAFTLSQHRETVNKSVANNFYLLKFLKKGKKEVVGC